MEACIIVNVWIWIHSTNISIILFNHIWMYLKNIIIITTH